MVKRIFRQLCAWHGYILIACIIPVPGWSQPLTLYDAVNKAITTYPLLQQRQAEIAAGKAHVTTINGNRLPSLTLHEQMDMGTDNPLQGAYFSLGTVPSTPGSYTTVHAVPNAGNVAISFLKWDFYTFGYYKAQQKEAKAQLAVSEAVMSSDQYLLTGNIISLYLDWLKKYRLLQIEKENVARAKVIFTSIRATVLSGLKPGVDTATAGAAYSEARLTYLQALDNYKNASITMATYTGADDHIAPDTMMLSPRILQQMQLAAMTDIIPANHPLLDVYNKQYEQQLAEHEAISRKYMPKVGLDAAAWVRSSGISTTGVYPTELTASMPYSTNNYLMGLTLTYNLFDLKHRHDELVESSLQAQAKQSALQTRQIDLNRMVQQANETYSITLEKLQELPVRLSSARQAYGQQVALYKSGLNTLIEVTNAQYELNRAEAGLVMAQDDLLQLLYMRAALSGRSDIFLQNFKR